MSVDLSTRYLGMTLKNPIVVSACTLTGKLDTLRAIEEAGASAVVLPSLFEEQIEHDQMTIHHFYEHHAETFAEAVSYFPELETANNGSERYLKHLEAAKSALKIPVIGSLNGTSTGGWIDYARQIENAGADALELNIYFVETDPNVSGTEVEARYLDLVASVRASIQIPLAVKIGPFFSSFANMAQRLHKSGANGLVLFNRFLQPDIDLDALRVTPHLEFSHRQELRLPLRWVAILRPQLLQASLAATSGVHSSEDVLKLLLAGADVTMVASLLYQSGIPSIRTLLDEVEVWLAEREYKSVEQLKGSLSIANAPDPDAFERANYVKTLATFTTESARV